MGKVVAEVVGKVVLSQRAQRAVVQLLGTYLPPSQVLLHEIVVHIQGTYLTS
jgi:hypothetical protein